MRVPDEPPGGEWMRALAACLRKDGRMVRFQCIHCGGRIAVNQRQLSRVARCPECGGVTHPLAADLARSQSPTDAKPHRAPDRSAAPAASPRSDCCANCGGAVGRLQKPRTWEGQTVCPACHRELADEERGTDNRSDNARSAPGRSVVSRDQSLAATESVLVVPSRHASPEPGRRESIPGAPGQRAFIESAPRAHGPSDLALALRSAGMGLFTLALALLLIVVILHSIGILLAWGVFAIGMLMAVYWVRRGVLVVRRRFASSPLSSALPKWPSANSRRLK